jgi:hypothetical protein
MSQLEAGTSNAAVDDASRVAAGARLVNDICVKGIAIWRDAQEHLAGGGDPDLLLLQTHHHVIEQLDAVGILLDHGAVEPSKLQLRTAFEALLALEYIAQQDTERRAYAWLVVVDVLDRIKTWDRLNETTPAGKQFAALKKTEGHGGLPAASSAAERRAILQEMLEEDPRWSGAYGEYRRVQVLAGKRRVEWYELFGGPKGPGLRNLALHLGHGTAYEILYRQWSRRIHGADVFQRVTKGDRGQILVQPLRYAAHWQPVVNFAVNFGLLSTRIILGRYLPDQAPAFAKWYVEQVRPRRTPADIEEG